MKIVAAFCGSQVQPTSLVSLPQATKSCSQLSPTKFFSLRWPLNLRTEGPPLAFQRRKVLSVEAETSSLSFMYST